VASQGERDGTGEVMRLRISLSLSPFSDCPVILRYPLMEERRGQVLNAGKEGNKKQTQIKNGATDPHPHLSMPPLDTHVVKQIGVCSCGVFLVQRQFVN